MEKPSSRRLMAFGTYVACAGLAGAIGLGALTGCAKQSQPKEEPAATQTAQAEAPAAVSQATKNVDAFSSATLEPGLRQYDASKPLDLTPNHYSAITPDEHVIFNDRVFEYDTTSGATVIPSRTKEEGESQLDPEVKMKKMFWSVRPPLGIIEGEFYHLDKKFNEGPHQDKADDNDYFLGTTDLVVNKGKIVHVEFDEIPAKSYYNQMWAAQTKRRSGYAFFQASKPRTDKTLVTWVNGETFLEWQILKHNSLNLIFDTVHGSSNSARDVFIPSAGILAEQVKEPSGKYYIGISVPQESGLVNRLELIFEGKNIVEARYDEIFSDYRDQIKDPELQQFYRQSKRDSVPYAEKDGGAFREYAKKFAETLASQGTLDLTTPAFSELEGWEEFAHVKDLANQVKPAVDKYLAEGYTHDIGKITERPAGMTERPDQVNRTEEIKMELKNTVFNADKTSVKVTVAVENTSDEDYKLATGSFYMYVRNKDNFFDTIGDHNYRDIDIPAHQTVDVELEMDPLVEGDSDLALKYDGRNKVFASMVLPTE